MIFFITIFVSQLGSQIIIFHRSYYLNNQVSEFNEFEPRLKSAENWFQQSAGLNLEKLYTILSGTNHI